MTVLVDTPAAAPPAVTPATVRRRAMLALARVESVRMLRHPVTIAAFLLYLGPWVWMLVRPGGDRAPLLHAEVASLQLTAMLLLAGAALVVANLAALRESRHRTDAVSDLLVLPPAWRTGGFLVAVLALGALTLVVVAAQILVLALLPGAAGTVIAFDVLMPAAIVTVLGAAGVLLARLTRSAVVAPLAAVVFTAAGFVSGAATGLSWGRFLPALADDLPIELPTVLLDRPAARHFAYLLGVAALLATLALLRSGATVRRTLPALVAAVAVTVAAGSAQLDRGDSVAAARVALTADPVSAQTCSVRSGVTYCAFDDMTAWIPTWDAVTRGVLRRVPAPAGPPLAVRQWVGADGYPLGSGIYGAGVEETAARHQREVDTAAGTPEAVPIGTAWGDDRSAATLAAGVAYRVVTGRAVAGNRNLCGARGALVVWLAGQATDRTPAGVRSLDQSSHNALAFVEGPSTAHLMVWDRDAAVGLALLRRPADQVAPVVTAHWAELTAPDTTIEQAAAVFDVPVDQAPAPDLAGRCDP